MFIKQPHSSKMASQSEIPAKEYHPDYSSLVINQTIHGVEIGTYEHDNLNKEDGHAYIFADFWLRGKKLTLNHDQFDEVIDKYFVYAGDGLDKDDFHKKAYTKVGNEYIMGDYDYERKIQDLGACP